jgi:hypothetical protein
LALKEQKKVQLGKEEVLVVQIEAIQKVKTVNHCLILLKDNKIRKLMSLPYLLLIKLTKIQVAQALSS